MFMSIYYAAMTGGAEEIEVRGHWRRSGPEI
jgi:hypothetical protein